MSEILSPLTYQLGIGGIGGFVVGYAFKKISKLIIVLIGLFIIALLYLGTSGIIKINYDKLWTAVTGLFNSVGGTFSWFISIIISLLPFAGSFLVGFLIGFKLG